MVTAQIEKIRPVNRCTQNVQLGVSGERGALDFLGRLLRSVNLFLGSGGDLAIEAGDVFELLDDCLLYTSRCV